MLIDGYSAYSYANNSVFKNKDNTMITKTIISDRHHIFKLKDDNGNWKSISLSEVKARSGEKLQVPFDAVLIKHSDGNSYITPSGDILVFTNANKLGIYLKPHRSYGKYPSVTITYKQTRKTIGIHVLVAENFIMDNYVAMGLCCMHSDDNKDNFHLSNLEVGTYSQNNRDAYKRGLNTGNKRAG